MFSSNESKHGNKIESSISNYPRFLKDASLFESTEISKTAGSSVKFNNYLRRLHKFSDLEVESHFLMMLLIVSRFLERVRVIYTPEELCPYKISATALFIMQKMHLDKECWYLKEFGVISGLTAPTLGQYELAMCRVLNFELYVDHKLINTLNDSIQCQYQKHNKKKEQNTLPLESKSNKDVLGEISCIFYSMELALDMIVKMG